MHRGTRTVFRAGGAKELWLCPAAARLDDRATLLPLSAVLPRLGRCGAGRRLLLVDACRREGDPPAAGPRAGLLEPPGSTVVRPPLPAGVAAVFSCRPGERSSEIDGDAHGVFGAAVLDYLEGRAPAGGRPADATSGRDDGDALVGREPARPGGRGTAVHDRDGAAVQPELAMARLYNDPRLLPAARTMIERALRAAGSDPAVVLASAQWHLNMNEVPMARSLADKGLAMSPGSLEAKVVRGAVALAERDLGTAERMFGAALALAPDNFAAGNLLAAALIESPDAVKRARALELAESNAARFRDDAKYRTTAQETVAWVYHQLGRREEASGIFVGITDSDSLTADGAY